MPKRYMMEFDPDLAERHPGTLAVLQWFRWEHLRPSLHDVARPFAELAVDMVTALPDSPELIAGLRKLMEAKDCMVRAAVHLEETDHVVE